MGLFRLSTGMSVGKGLCGPGGAHLKNESPSDLLRTGFVVGPSFRASLTLDLNSTKAQGGPAKLTWMWTGEAPEGTEVRSAPLMTKELSIVCQQDRQQ